MLFAADTAPPEENAASRLGREHAERSRTTTVFYWSLLTDMERVLREADDAQRTHYIAAYIQSDGDPEMLRRALKDTVGKLPASPYPSWATPVLIGASVLGLGISAFFILRS